MSKTETVSAFAERAAILTHAVTETAKHLDIGPSDLAAIVGISQSSASRMFNGSFLIKEGTPEWQLAALFVRLYRGLFSIVGNSDALAREWLTTGNRAFDGRNPLEVIKSIIGLVAACDYIDAHRAQI
ncbi:MAG: DUF2384 domain-containing protein [Sulfurimicrobium sp.]|nr:DUF2384 domain-containing protein [Sulfurimicrobium sp.]